MDVVIVPAHWRAGDIVCEMRGCGIACEAFRGHLVDYLTAPHPHGGDDGTTHPAPTLAAGSLP